MSTDDDLCSQGDNAKVALSNNGLAEDVEMARSMRKVGIMCEDTRDEEGRETFLPMNIDHLRFKYTHTAKPYFWYWRYSYYPTRDGLVSPCMHGREILFSMFTAVFLGMLF